MILEDNKYNDTEHCNAQHNDNLLQDTTHQDTRHCDAQNNDTQYNDTWPNDITEPGYQHNIKLSVIHVECRNKAPYTQYAECL